MPTQNETEKIRRALDLKHLALPAKPRLVGLEFSIGEDVGGDPAIFVIGVFPNSFRDADWTRENLDPIEQAIRKALDAAGISRWLYTRYARVSDMKAAG